MKIQKKPYEISLWTVVEGDEGKLEEKKIGIIGSNEIENSPIRAIEPHLIENINGSKTLIFSIFWRYYNPIKDIYESNPWEKYLVNERKVKLKYDDEWYEFVLKETEESKEEYKKTFTCVSAPILELSRNGYNVELDDSLYNNQGTIYELSQRIVDESDWIVDEENSDKIYSFYTEHLYKAITTKGFSVVNVIDPTDRKTVERNSFVYLFYSEIENNNSPLQMIIGDINEKDKDSNNIIINEPIYLYDGSLDNFEIEELVLTYKGTRYVLSQLGHYDPILKAFVKDYEINGQRKYGYVDTEYITSDVIGNLINNPKDYTLTKSAENIGSWGTQIQNWYASPGTALSQSCYPPICDLGNISTGTKINLETDPTETPISLMLWKFTNNSDYVYNTSMKENLNFLPNGIIKGNRYVFRIKYGLTLTKNISESGGIPAPTKGPGETGSTGKYYWSTPKLQALKCEVFNNNKCLEGMSTTVCTYAEESINSPQEYERVEGIIDVTNPAKEEWYENINGNFIKTTNTIYSDDIIYYKKIVGKSLFPYYYGIMTAQKSYSKEELNNSSFQIRISNTNANSDYYVMVEDVEFFEYIPDEKDIQKYHTSLNTSINFFYPPNSPLISSINQTLKIFDQEENILATRKEEFKWEAEFKKLTDISDYVPKYNDYLAINSINGAQSNYYNLIQELCEMFQCWADFQIDHAEDGSINKSTYYYLTPDIIADASTEYYRQSGYYIPNIKEDDNPFLENWYEKNGDVYELTSDVEVNPNKTYYKYFDDYNLIIPGETLINGIPYDPYDISKYYNPQLLNWYEKKITGKRIVFKKFIGRENYAGFRYGINLSNISRSLDSNSFVSKMIVSNNENENLQNGICSITRAKDNPSGSTSIYDFTYYINQGLIDKVLLEKDLYVDDEDSDYIGFYPKMKNLSETYNELTKTWLLAAEEKITQESRKQIYQTEADAARTQKSEALEDLCAFIRYCSGLIGYVKGKTVMPSDEDCFDIISTFVKNYWDKDSNHNSTIDYWLKYINANDVLKRALLEFNAADLAYNRAKTIYDSIDQQRKEIQANINLIIKKFNIKYADFLQEGTWNDDNAIDDDLYFYDAVNILKVSAQPQISYQINVIELSELEGYELYDFRIGDKTYIEDTEFFGWTTSNSPYREEVIISEINWTLDDPSTNQITVQNYRTQFEDLFQRMSAVVQQAELNKNAYNRAAQIIQPSGKIDQGALQKTFTENQNQLQMGFGTGTITQNSEGIIIEGLGINRKNKLKITGKGIFISQDNGNTWTPVMRGTGTNASTLTDGSLDVSNINIIDGNYPSFQWNGDGLTAYGFNDIIYTKIDTESPYEDGAWEKGNLSEINIGIFEQIVEEGSNNGD